MKAAAFFSSLLDRQFHLFNLSVPGGPVMPPSLRLDVTVMSPVRASRKYTMIVISCRGLHWTMKPTLKAKERHSV